MNILQTTELYILKGWILWYMTYTSIKQLFQEMLDFCFYHEYYLPFPSNPLTSLFAKIYTNPRSPEAWVSISSLIWTMDGNASEGGDSPRKGVRRWSLNHDSVFYWLVDLGQVTLLLWASRSYYENTNDPDPIHLPGLCQQIPCKWESLLNCKHYTNISLCDWDLHT